MPKLTTRRGTAARINLTPSNYQRRHVPDGMSYSKPDFPGMLSEETLNHGDTVVVHALDAEGIEVYQRKLRIAGRPHTNELGLRVIDVYEGPYDLVALNIARGTTLFAGETTPVSLWDIGVIQHPIRNTWNTRRYTTRLP